MRDGRIPQAGGSPPTPSSPYPTSPGVGARERPVGSPLGERADRAPRRSECRGVAQLGRVLGKHRSPPGPEPPGTRRGRGSTKGGGKLRQPIRHAAGEAGRRIPRGLNYPHVEPPQPGQGTERNECRVAAPGSARCPGLAPTHLPPATHPPGRCADCSRCPRRERSGGGGGGNLQCLRE